MRMMLQHVSLYLWSYLRGLNVRDVFGSLTLLKRNAYVVVYAAGGRVLAKLGRAPCVVITKGFR